MREPSCGGDPYVFLVFPKEARRLYSTGSQSQTRRNSAVEKGGTAFAKVLQTLPDILRFTVRKLDVAKASPALQTCRGLGKPLRSQPLTFSIILDSTYQAI
jgi:hypothetical protein